MGHEEGGDLRARLEQRLVVGPSHVAIGGLSRIARGSPLALTPARSTLMVLADGGPFTKWFDKRSGEDALSLPQVPDTPSDLVRAICSAVRSGSVHLEHVDDDFERFFSRLSINVQERVGLSLPHLSESNAAWCRHFATSVSRAYSEIASGIERFAKTAVLFVMGIPDCHGEPGGLHAWNWLVDFGRGTVAAFDPQNEQIGKEYANASSLLYTFARMRADGWPVPGLPMLVRRHDSIYGATMLFQLARYPIDRASRRAIYARLRSTRFERVVADWERELEAWDAAWGHGGGVDVGDFVRLSDA